jgi:capsular polysaccharide biosynthesis protein
MIDIVNIRSVHHVNVAEIESSAFNAPPPTILRGELIPPDQFKAMNISWNRGQFEKSLISVDKLFDVFVTSEGLVFTQNRELIAESVTQHSVAEQQQALERISILTKIPEVRTSCLLMRKRGDHNYGHWLVEILPKLPIAQSICDISAVAIPFLEGATHSVIVDSLQLITGTRRLETYQLHKDQVFFFKELVLVSGLTNHGVYMSPNSVAALEEMASSVSGEGGRRLFVSRRGAPRNLIEDRRVESELESHGFTILHPGNMTLLQQIAAFKNAEVVVGVIGAGMSNMVFAPKGATVINLTPSSMPDTFFYFLSVHKNQHYTELRIPVVDNSSWDQGIRVSSQEILNLLK